MRPAANPKNIATYARPLISTALIAGGLMQLAAPVLAQSLPEANSSISNTATASYEDPNTPNVPISTVSNTVTVTVAKIAGILVTEAGFTQPKTTDAFKPNETVYSNFDVRNTGNDGVQFKVPKLADVSSNVTFNKVQYSVNGTDWLDAGTVAGTDSPIIAVGGILKVRIVSTINGNAVAGDDIVSTLGNTSTPGLVNAQRGVGKETIDGKDIYTVDVADANGSSVKLGGVAANGVREASATQKVKVNAVKEAFAIVSLTNETPVVVDGTKDNIKYNISVTVPTTDPNGTGKVATDLAPTAIKLATNEAATTPADVNRVIISNPLPTGATLTIAPTAPPGWTPVYAITPVTPGTPTVWSTVAPTDLTTVKQVGFIYEPTPTLPSSVPAPTGTSLPATSTPYTGFAVTLTTPKLGDLTNVVSIGGTTPTATGEPDPTKLVVATATNLVTTVRAATISDLYNGPESKPQATGPNNDNNKDFTNKSMQLGVADAKRDAITGELIPTVSSSVVTFNNTIENKTNVAGDVYVLPTPPASPRDLPPVTTVTIKNINGSDTRSYRYDGTMFKPIAGEENLTPLKLAIGGNGLVSYAVDVTLPVGRDQLKGYPVPVTAFTGPTAPTTATTIPGDAVKNITIDRVYTGYIDLIKEARLLSVITDQDNTTIPYLKGTAAESLKAVPGKFIQYRIRAVNISEDTSGGSVDSKVLSATKVKMLENGLVLPNNWGTTTSHAPDSAKTRLGSTLLPSGTIEYNLGAKDNSDPTVSRYDVNLGTNLIAPKQEGSFSFVRKVNDTGIVTPVVTPVSAPVSAP